MNAKPKLQTVATYETEARSNLAAHLDRLDDAAAVVADFDGQFKRLRSLVEAERNAVATLEGVRAEQAKDLADAVREGRLLPGNNTDEIAEAEHAVRMAQRDADAARRVLPDVERQLNVARAELMRLHALTPPTVAHVLAEESARLSAELMKETERMRARAATVWGLRMLMATFEQPEMRGFLSRLGDAHFEWPLPSNQAASAEADRWSALYAALQQDPTARIEEIAD